MGLLRTVRLFFKAITSASSPRQLALGFALGMIIGLVPKGNLIAVALGMLLFGSRVNLAAGLTAAFLFTWMSGLFDPVAHSIGYAFLTQKWLQPTWAYLYDLPLVPWTSFNNTVVFGSLLLGMWLFYPVYRLSLVLFERGQPMVVERARKYRVVRVLAGAELASNWRGE